MKGEAFRESFFSARSAHGPLRQILQRKRMSVFGGTAEVLERALNVEVDPTATLAVHCGNGFDAGFSRYQSTRLSRYNAVS